MVPFSGPRTITERNVWEVEYKGDIRIVEERMGIF
jgi:hypothetical protein